MALRRRGRTTGEAGVTLVEVLLAVTIMSVVVGALSTALIVAMRSTSSATERIAGSQSAQLLTKWFAGDVQQADPGPGGVDTDPATAAGCATSEGSNVVRFRTTDGPTTSYVGYRLVQAPEEWRLVRYACADGGPADTLVAAHHLQASPHAVKATVTGATVALEVLEVTGYAFTALGARVLDGAALACNAALTVSDPEVELTAAGELPAPVVAAATPAGFCAGPWSVELSPAPAGATGPLTLVEGGGTWQADLASPAYTWAPGVVTLTLVDGDGHPHDTAELELLAPPPAPTTPPPPAPPTPPPTGCWADLSVSPDTLTLTPTGRLPEDVTVTAQVGTGCPAALKVYYQRGPKDTLPSVDFILHRNQAWTGTIDEDDGTWAPGEVDVRIVKGQTTLDTATLTLLPAPRTGCQLVDGTPSAAPGNAPADKAGHTKQEIRIVMQPTTNDNTPCLGLAARLRTESGHELTFLVGAEGQNVTAAIPVGTGPFKKDKTVHVDIVDTLAGDALVATSSFTTFRQ